ncbi:MAG: fasciclin domain-containing protein [Bryobacteraceae bacterium]
MSSQDQTTKDQTVSEDLDRRLSTMNLLDTMASDPSLSEFVAAIRATGLQNNLAGPDLLTVLAPLNAAFEHLDRAIDPAMIGQLARTHILPGAWTAAELARSGSVKTLQGGTLAIHSGGVETKIGGIRIARADIECTNGVLHILDGVLNV